MRRFTAIFLLILTAGGCGPDASSLRPPERLPSPPPVWADTFLADDSVLAGRVDFAPDTAIEVEPETEPSPPDPSPASCDPNYSPCVPIASDVDCARGKGDGPVFVDGPVKVVGTDVYKLDRDGDGIGCDR